jgi:hypothetical protein
MINYLHKTNAPFFSILICSLYKRKHYLKRLENILNKQLHNDIEIIYAVDNGEMSIGDKRNKLLNSTHDNSEFLAFIDDDDLVSENYVSIILNALYQCPDVVGMMGIMTTDGRNPKTFIHSMQYDHWYESGGIYYRMPNHLNPVRKEYALATKFPLINSGEDHDYSNRMFNLLKGKKEIYIPEPIYFYDYRTRK